MARPSRPWFRVYVEIVSDPKIRRLTPAQRWLWISLLAIARSSPVPGAILLRESCEMQAEDVREVSGVRACDVTKGMRKMHELGLIERDDALGAWRISRWNDRQYETDNSADRVQRHRALKRPNAVTSPNVVTPTESESDTETDTERQSVVLQVQQVAALAVDRLTATYPSTSPSPRHRDVLYADVIRRHGDEIARILDAHPDYSPRFVAAHLDLGANVR